MPILTTTIGAYPKPDYVRLPDWFTVEDGPDTATPTAGWEAALAAMGDDADDILTRGTVEAVHDQVEAGIDIPTDGEIRRENYIHYHCRHLQGFDFQGVTEKSLETAHTVRFCQRCENRFRYVRSFWRAIGEAPKLQPTSRSKSRCPVQ